MLPTSVGWSSEPSETLPTYVGWLSEPSEMLPTYVGWLSEPSEGVYQWAVLPESFTSGVTFSFSS